MINQERLNELVAHLVPVLHEACELDAEEVARVFAGREKPPTKAEALLLLLVLAKNIADKLGYSDSTDGAYEVIAALPVAVDAMDLPT